MKLLLPVILIIITSHISFAKNRKVSNVDQQLLIGALDNQHSLAI